MTVNDLDRLCFIEKLIQIVQEAEAEYSQNKSCR